MAEPTVKVGDLGSAPIIPMILIFSGGYLAWFGVHYFRRNIKWPSDPVKSVLQGHGLPPQGDITTSAAILTASAETQQSQSSSSGGSSGGGKITTPANSSQRAWAVAQLASIQAPASPANVDSLCSWANRESPWNASPPDGAEYTHNPLNTTEQLGAVGEVNSVNVAIYPDWSTGIRATAITLVGYPQITARLRSGLGLCGWSSSDFSRWSGGGYSSVC